MGRWTDRLMRRSRHPVENEPSGSMVLDPRSGRIITAAKKKEREALSMDRLDRALHREVERYKAIVTSRIVDVKQEVKQ